MRHTYDEPLFLISVVAKILNIHPQTLRQYEREGLIEPSRTSGKMRLYSQRDIDRIEMILRLTRELGVNLAGVDIIMRLKEQVDKMEDKIEELHLKIDELENPATSRVPKNRSLKTKKSMYEIIIFGS